MGNSRKIVGSRITARLEAIGGQSEVWLAKQVGMTQQGINDVVRGKSARPRKLSEMVRALETTEEYLFGETDDPRPIPSAKGFFRKISRLSLDDQRVVLDLIESLASKQAARGRASRRREA